MEGELALSVVLAVGIILLYLEPWKREAAVTA